MLTFALDMLRRLYALSGRVLPSPSALPQPEPAPAAGDLIFRMRAWPQLPEDGRTAEIYRVLSVMSSQPVNRRWLLSRCRMTPHQLDALLQRLIADGSIEVIDPKGFARG